MIEESGAIIHVESPSERTDKSRFEVRGWIAANSPVEAVMLGRSVLALCERPDVVRAYPARESVCGFSGKGRHADLAAAGLLMPDWAAGSNPAPDDATAGGAAMGG